MLLTAHSFGGRPRQLREAPSRWHPTGLGHACRSTTLQLLPRPGQLAFLELPQPILRGQQTTLLVWFFRSQEVSHRTGCGSASAISAYDNHGNLSPGSQFCDARCPGDAVRDFQDAVWIFVDQNWGHSFFRRSKLANLLVQFPGVGTAGPTGRQSEIFRVDLPGRNTHSSRLTPIHSGAHDSVCN